MLPARQLPAGVFAAAVALAALARPAPAAQEAALSPTPPPAAAPRSSAPRPGALRPFDADPSWVWTASSPAAWWLGPAGSERVLELMDGPDAAAPRVRSPRRIALLDGRTFGDFDLEVEAQQTSREYGHRDLVVVFGFLGPERFYYVHFATTPDDSACNVFLVDGAPRRRLTEVPARGVDWGVPLGPETLPPWRRLRVQREGARIRAWFDGALVVEARDATLGSGLVGLGSFDDCGRFRRLSVTGVEGPTLRSPFAPVEAVAPLVDPDDAGATWPEGAGPLEDVLWRTPLPTAGQGGIVRHGERLFLATPAPVDRERSPTEAEPAQDRRTTEFRPALRRDVDAHCLDARTGAILWTRRIAGGAPAVDARPTADATSVSPVADRAHVWFTHATGRVACFDLEGERVWERSFTPPDGEACEPFLVPDGRRRVLVQWESLPWPASTEGAPPAGRTHHLVGLDATSGAVLWRSADALAPECASALVATEDGWCALVARAGSPAGSPAGPPRPLGASLVRLDGPGAGRNVWRHDDPRPSLAASMPVLARDERHAYWFRREPASEVVALDLATGAEVASVSLERRIACTTFDRERDSWATAPAQGLGRRLFPAPGSVHAANGYLFFRCDPEGIATATPSPPISFARVDVMRGEVEALDVPNDFERTRATGWRPALAHVPLRLGDRLQYAVGSGTPERCVAYVLATRTARFDGDALLAVDDLGPAGDIWPAHSFTYGGGHLFHRTTSEVVCFGYAPRPR